MNPFRYATENRALHVSAYMAEGTNYGPFGFMLGNKPQYIWKPGWKPAMVDSAINWELKSAEGPYHLTPNSKILAFKHNTKRGQLMGRLGFFIGIILITIGAFQMESQTSAKLALDAARPYLHQI